MATIEFFIPDFVVLPKQSTRVRIDPKAGAARCHPNPKTLDNAKALALLVAPYRPKRLWCGPISAVFTFFYGWRRRESKKTRQCLRRWKDTSPDCDNLAKQIIDVLQDAGFFRDDAQLTEVYIAKQWAQLPGVYVQLRQLDATVAACAEAVGRRVR